MSVLNKYIAQGEHLTQDFKFAIDDQKKIARTLVAFGNTAGGRLLIGVKDNGKIVGCHPEEEFHMIQAAAEMYCKPAIPFTSLVHKEGFRLVLEIQVSAQASKPYRALDEDGKWKAYFRNGDDTMLVNKILYQVWQNEKRKTAKPEKFGEKELQLLQHISKEREITLSQLYKRSALTMKEVDHWLALFVGWQVVDMILSSTNTTYKIADKAEK